MARFRPIERERMRRLKIAAAAFASVVSLLVGASGTDASASDGPSSLGVPGLYAWPASSLNYTRMQFTNMITVDPGPSANVFWADQFGNTVSGSGYIGIQTITNATGGKLVLFSVWDATGCRPNPNRTYGGWCVNNTDGAPGHGARIWYPWQANVNYRLTVRKTKTPGWWVARLYDPKAHKSVDIGSLQFGGPTGGQVYPSVGFVEYFNWPDPTATCGQQLASKSIFGPITGDAGTVNYGSTSTSSNCTYATHAAITSSGAAELDATP